MLIENAKHDTYNERDKVFETYINQVIDFYKSNLNINYNE